LNMLFRVTSPFPRFALCIRSLSHLIPRLPFSTFLLAYHTDLVLLRITSAPLGAPGYLPPSIHGCARPCPFFPLFLQVVTRWFSPNGYSWPRSPTVRWIPGPNNAPRAALRMLLSIFLLHTHAYGGVYVVIEAYCNEASSVYGLHARQHISFL